MPGLGKINIEWNNPDSLTFSAFDMYRFTNKTDTTYTDTTLINTKLITDTLYTDYRRSSRKEILLPLQSYTTLTSARAITPEWPGRQLLHPVPGMRTEILPSTCWTLSQLWASSWGNPQPFIFAAADVNHDSDYQCFGRCRYS